MPALSAYSNTENTALVILEELGYQCWYDDGAYCCEKEGWDFRAHSFTELLGVVRIFEYHKPGQFKEYWWKINEPWLLDDIAKEAPEFTPVWKKENENN